MVPLYYPNLHSLVITHESITDDLIVNLASSCKNLVSFQSGTCIKIADSTLKKLENLHSLQILSLGNADCMSGQTLLGILKSCKKLSHLSLLMTLLKFRFLTKDHQFESVRSLDLTLGPIDDVSIQKIVTSFPGLVELCLSNCVNLTTNSLSVIGSHCKHLECLNISYTGIDEFSEELGNLLMQIGANLHLLDLSGISQIKTSLFGKYCPRLEKLCLNHCPYMETEWITKPVRIPGSSRSSMKDFSLLEVCPLLVALQIDPRNKPSEDSDFDMEMILRGGAGLKSLAINSIPGFTDDSMQSTIEYMNLTELRHFNVSGNIGVTTAGIWLAIDAMCNLQTIKITECDVVTMEYNELMKKCRRKGFELDILR